MITIVSGAENILPFQKHVVPLLEANGVEVEFHNLDQGIPSEGIVVLMGGDAFQILKDTGAVKPKNMSINKGREVIFDNRIFVSYDPNIIDLDPTREPDVAWDIQKVCRFVQTGSVLPTIGDYRWVTSQFIYDGLQLAVLGEKEAIPLSIDLETMGLDPFNPEKRILTISFTVRRGSSWVWKVPVDGQPDEYMHSVLQLISNPKLFRLTGANLKFDIIWILEKWGIRLENEVLDTTLVGALLNENRSNSLNVHAKIYTQIGGYDDDFEFKYDKAHMEVPLEEHPDEFLTYAGGDTDAVFRCYPIFKKQLLQRRKLAKFYTKVLQPAAKVFAKMEHRGIYLDLPQFDVVEDIVKKDIAAYYEKLIELVPRRLQLKHQKKNEPVSLTPNLLKDLMFTPMGYDLTPQKFTDKTKEPSTDKDHLQMFRDVPEAKEFIELLGMYNQGMKTLSTYIQGFRGHIRATGRWHPTYQLARADYGRGKDDGTVTGRTSTTAPAYQTLPKHTKYAKLLRKMIGCPKGMVAICIDFSQGELRIFAVLSNEIRMIAAYNQGIDVHMITGAEAKGLTFEDAMLLPAAERKVVRQGGKAGNFGLIYRVSPAGFVDYARKTYQVVMSLEAAEDFQKRFFARWPSVPTYHKAQVALAQEDGYVVGPLGRERHLPLIHSRNSKTRGEAERQAINSPTQGGLSDMGLLAMVEMDREYPDFYFFGFVHDDLQAYVPEDNWEFWAKKLQEKMENLPLKELFGWELPLRMQADISQFSTNMAEASEYSNVNGVLIKAA